MKQTFEKVGELREQKQQIQADIADMLCFMSKVRGGGPDVSLFFFSLGGPRVMKDWDFEGRVERSKLICAVRFLFLL